MNNKIRYLLILPICVLFLFSCQKKESLTLQDIINANQICFTKDRIFLLYNTNRNLVLYISDKKILKSYNKNLELIDSTEIYTYRIDSIFKSSIQFINIYENNKPNNKEIEFDEFDLDYRYINNEHIFRLQETLIDSIYLDENKKFHFYVYDISDTINKKIRDIKVEINQIYYQLNNNDGLIILNSASEHGVELMINLNFNSQEQFKVFVDSIYQNLDVLK